MINYYFQATRTPTRDENGVDLLCKYYNLLYFAERRFFPVDRNIGLYFEWYDSLTGNNETILFTRSSRKRVDVARIYLNLKALWHRLN